MNKLFKINLSPKARHVALLSVSALSAYAFLVLLRGTPHVTWGDDCMYLLNTQALLGKISYVHNGYVFNVLNPHKGPPFYPPGTAALLLPAYAFFGIDPTALTSLLTGYLVAALIFAYLYFTHAESGQEAAAAIVFFVVSPSLVGYASVIASEFPFMLWQFAALFVMQDRERADTTQKRILYSSCIGALIYLAYATREVGALLLPAMIFYDIVRGRNLIARLAPAVVTFGSAVVVQHLILADHAGYLRIVVHEIVHVYALGGRDVILNARAYLGGFRSFFFAGPPVIARLIGGVALLLVGIGIALRLRSRFQAESVNLTGRGGRALRLARMLPFDILYIVETGVLLLSLPPDAMGGWRYLLPLAPFYMWYIAISVGRLRSVQWRTAVYAVYAVVAALFVVLPVAAESYDVLSGSVSVSDTGPQSSEATEMFRAVNRIVPGQATVVFSQPRPIPLFARRRAIAWPEDTRQDSLVRFLKDGRFAYVLVAKPGILPYTEIPGVDPGDVGAVLKEVHTRIVFANAAFRLYHITY